VLHLKEVNLIGPDMRKTATVHSRIDEKIKTKAERILYAIGITPSDAINMFYRQIIFKAGIPFSVEIPNKKTIRAIEDLENNKDIKSFNDVTELFNDLED
jgi:DNA-damage-inducible protein J